MFISALFTIVKLWKQPRCSITDEWIKKLWFHDKARTHKEGMRIGKTLKKLDSISCPQCRETKADTLKQLRPIGEGDQELEKKLVQEELT
jgi:hypothetical protein